MNVAREKDIQWMKFVLTVIENGAPESNSGVTWGVYNARKTPVSTPKTIKGTYPLHKESSNSHAMMRHTIDIAM